MYILMMPKGIAFSSSKKIKHLSSRPNMDGYQIKRSEIKKGLVVADSSFGNPVNKNFVSCCASNSSKTTQHSNMHGTNHAP